MDTPTSEARPETETTMPFWRSIDWLGYVPDGARGLVPVWAPGPAQPCISARTKVSQARNGIREHAFMSGTNSGVWLAAGKAICEKTSGAFLWKQEWASGATRLRSEEHTSELQSRQYLVCRLL